MKQLLQTGMATRLLGILAAFFMMVAVQAMAQKQSTGSNASGGSTWGNTVGPPSDYTEQPVVAEKGGKRSLVTRNATDVIQIGQNKYTDWESAVQSLQANDVIVLLQDLELDVNTAVIPTVACSITGNTGREVLSYKENGECKTLLMKAPVTFKNIILDMDGIMAGGFSLVMDEGSDVSDAMKKKSFRIWGGAFDKDVTTTSITVKSGNYDYIYGGSSTNKVTGKAFVDILGGTVNWIFGGGASVGSTVGQTKVTVSGGKIATVLCAGGMRGDVEGNTELTVENNASVNIAYGGGYYGKVAGTCLTTVTGGSIACNLYGGGSDESAICGNTEVVISGGTIGSVDDVNYYLMGGGDAAPVTDKAKVKINGGTFNCFVVAGGGVNNLTTAVCRNTELIISGGTFNKWTYGGGGSSPVLETATLRVSGSPVFSKNLYGGGLTSTATCKNTDVQVSGGTLNGLYGGGEYASVTGKSKLVIDGSASAGWTFGGCLNADCGSTDVTLNTTGTIDGGLFGGCRSGSCTTTNVNMIKGTVTDNIYAGGEQEDSFVTGDTYITVDGGSCIGVYGGGWKGQVKGTTHVLINGGTMSNGIYGGGFGDSNPDDGYDADMGRVGSTQVFVKKTTVGDNIVYGGGNYAGVTGNTNVMIGGGSFSQVWGGCYTENRADTPFLGSVGGDVNVLVRGGEIEWLGAARGQIPGQLVPVGGNMSLMIEGGTITRTITSGNDPVGKGYKPCTLTIRGLGTGNTPYSLPVIEAITDLVLDGSTVKLVPVTLLYPGFVIKEDNPLTITGTGKLVGTDILLKNFDISSLFTKNKPLVIGDNLSETATFAAYKSGGGDNVATFPVYKAGNTYRSAGDKSDKLRNIAFTPAANGLVSVVWDSFGLATRLEDSDQVPEDTKLSLSVVPNVGYRLKNGSLKVYKTGDENTTVTVLNNAFNMPAYNVTVFAEFEKIPYVPEPEPEPTVFYTVSIPSVEGVTTDPVAGDYEIEAWDSFRFYLTLDKDYDQSEPIVTTDRGETLVPRTSDGAYIVKYVRSDVEIFIDGIVKNPDPVANAEIESGTKAWVSNHRLFIRTDKAEDVFIYTFGGELRKIFRSAGGEEQIPLSSGSYIIRIGEDDFKVIL